MKFNENPMDQKIFTLGLDVNSISAYLCCCGILAEGALTKERLLNVWNQSEEALDEAMEILESRNIVVRVRDDEFTDYKANPSSLWRLPS